MYACNASPILFSNQQGYVDTAAESWGITSEEALERIHGIETQIGKDWETIVTFLNVNNISLGALKYCGGRIEFGIAYSSNNIKVEGGQIIATFGFNDRNVGLEAQLRAAGATVIV